MNTVTSQKTNHKELTDSFDVIVVGAGISGLYQLHSARSLGLSVRCFEAGGGVGGTWFWNRYPGARFDSESWSYAYSWSKEVTAEWNWKEQFAPQPETLEYLNFVADKHDLKRDIKFNSRVKSAVFDDETSYWTVETHNGDKARCHYLIFAVGMLSAENIPNIKGRENFKGRQWHTSQWEPDPNGYGGTDMGLKGKRVAVIGTGATGIQCITELAKFVGDLNVFQISPDYALPLRNSKIDKELMDQIRSELPRWYEVMKTQKSQFIHHNDPRNTAEAPPEEQEAVFEKMYNTPGFAKWVGGFADSLDDKAANDLITDFMKKKIRERINDPELERKLVPTTHGFGLRRVPMDSGYYEVYKQDNVHLVALNETPIVEINETGIRTSDGKQYDVDAIIYATGFDAYTGMFKRMDIRGEGGQALTEKWDDGPQTYLGLQVEGFPNMFTLVGPHNGANFCNLTRCIEQNVEFVTGFLKYLVDNNIDRVQPDKEAQEKYTRFIYDAYDQTLMSTVDAWWTGTNIEGKKKRFLAYSSGMPSYRAMCEKEAASGYANFIQVKK